MKGSKRSGEKRGNEGEGRMRKKKKERGTSSRARASLRGDSARRGVSRTPSAGTHARCSRRKRGRKNKREQRGVGKAEGVGRK